MAMDQTRLFLSIAGRLDCAKPVVGLGFDECLEVLQCFHKSFSQMAIIIGQEGLFIGHNRSHHLDGGGNQCGCCRIIGSIDHQPARDSVI